MKLATVLLVEDNENDVILTKEGLKQAKISIDLHHVWNGEECLQFLRNEEPYEDSPRPDIILLDMNMPVMNGKEVLEEIIHDDDLKSIPVVVLTTSSADKDILDMYQLRCSSYIVKPVDFNQFLNVVKDFTGYWFTLVVMPADKT